MTPEEIRHATPTRQPSWEKDRYSFMKGAPAQGFPANYADDPKMRLFACCIVTQQEAGFGATLDLREVRCETCKAPGFNTGWGYWAHTCGAETLTDGEESQPCSSRVGEG